MLGAKGRRLYMQSRMREGSAAGLLQERVLSCAFAWFSAPVAYFGGWSAAEARYPGPSSSHEVPQTSDTCTVAWCRAPNGCTDDCAVMTVRFTTGEEQASKEQQ